MRGWWRVWWLHLLAFGGGLLVVLGVLVHGTIDQVNQINLVSARTALAIADSVVAAIEGEARAQDWLKVQARLRAATGPYLRLHLRVLAADGTVLADSQQIQANGHLVSPVAVTALSEHRSVDQTGATPYELMAARPLDGIDGLPHAVLVVEAGWERQYSDLRRAIEREAATAALGLLVLVTGAFVVVWVVGAGPLHHLRLIAEQATTRPMVVPSFILTDLHAIGQAIHDLSGCKLRLEAEVRKLQQERDDAKAANQAKSDFLARMSHDLRTPLHGIIGFSAMIRDQMIGPVGTVRYLEYANDIHQSGVHLLHLVNDMLDISKIEAGRFELANDLIEVPVVIQETCHAVSPLAGEKGLRISTVIPNNLPNLTADEKSVRQVLFNLLSNAIKFTPSGGKIMVTASAAAHGLDISVTDSGIGIEADEIDLVLTQYGQARSARAKPAEGTGLGLLIVKSLIEAHNGRVQLSSKPGCGTAVTLTFPRERLTAIDGMGQSLSRITIEG